ncbi:MAG TPA: putative ABC transporter permease [bacterium]|nr:putative ABC transporter permease [bacterium]
MDINSGLTLILYFFGLAFLGWVIEVLYRSYQARRLVNPGFLFGPFVPIYGVAGLLILSISTFLGNNLPWWILLLLMALVVTILEYLTSVLVELIFRVRLWDYSDEPLNLAGRVSLKYSFYWAVLIYLYLTLLAGPLLQFLLFLPQVWKLFLVIVLSIYFAVDFVLSARVYLYFFALYHLVIGELAKAPSELSNTLLSGLRKYSYFFRHYPYLRFKLRKQLRSARKVIWDLPDQLKKIKNLLDDKE